MIKKKESSYQKYAYSGIFLAISINIFGSQNNLIFMNTWIFQHRGIVHINPRVSYLLPFQLPILYMERALVH